MSNDRPISEQFRVVAKRWVEADGAARLLEESKTAWVAERENLHADVSAAAATRAVKSSPEYRAYVNQMVTARTNANLLKVQMEYIRMRHIEQSSAEASARAERRM